MTGICICAKIKVENFLNASTSFFLESFDSKKPKTRSHTLQLLGEIQLTHGKSMKFAALFSAAIPF
jgi:hypothetical protein